MQNDDNRPLIDESPHIGGEVFVIVVFLGCLGLTIALYLADRNGSAWIVSAIPVALAFFWVLWTFAQRRRRIRVFADRIEQRTLFGTSRLRFEQVERIRLGPFRQSHASYESEVRAYLDEVGLGDQHFELGATAESDVRLHGRGVEIRCALGYSGNSVALWRQVSPLVLPKLCEKLDQQIDETGGVRFGNLTARPEGIESSKGLIPWSKIDSIVSGPAGVRLTATKHPELTVTVPAETDNLLALLRIKELRNARH